MPEIEQQIKQFIVDNFLFGGSIEDVDDDASFMQTGVIDSLGVLQLISFVEEAFAVTVADEEVLPANFDSVANLAKYIRTKTLVPTAT